jgi:hypothetical protein
VTEPAPFRFGENLNLRRGQHGTEFRVVPEKRHHPLVRIPKHGIDAIAPAFTEIPHPVARIGLKHQVRIARAQRIPMRAAGEMTDAQLLQTFLEGLLQLGQGQSAHMLLNEGFRNI